MRKEPGNATVYLTVDHKIVAKLFIVAEPQIVQSFIDDVNDSSPHYVAFLDTFSTESR